MRQQPKVVRRGNRELHKTKTDKIKMVQLTLKQITDDENPTTTTTRTTMKRLQMLLLHGGGSGGGSSDSGRLGCHNKLHHRFLLGADSVDAVVNNHSALQR